MKFETTWIYFLRDIFSTVVVVVRLSYIDVRGRLHNKSRSLILVCFKSLELSQFIHEL